MITADNQGTRISGSPAPLGLIGSWCVRPAGRTFAAKRATAMGVHAKRTAAIGAGSNRDLGRGPFALMTDHRASSFPKFRCGRINHAPPPTAIGVTRRPGIVGARKLQFQIAPSHQNAITRQGSVQRIRYPPRQTGGFDCTSGDLDAEAISITHPVCPRRPRGNPRHAEQNQRQGEALRDRIQQCC